MNYEGGSSYGVSGRSSGAWSGNRSNQGQRGSPQAPGGGGRAASLGVHDSGFKIGQSVQHARFGQGVILALEGSGEDARAQIQFKRDGMKWLALAVAKIEPA